MDTEEINIKVLEVVNSCLDGTELIWEDANEELVSAGMDSIAFIRMIVALEDAFDCRIPDEKLQIEEMDTLNKIAEVLCSVIDGNVESI